MSSDNYYLVRKHPSGGYTAISCSASDDDGYYPPAETRHPEFKTVHAAYKYASAQYSEYGTQVHDECREDWRLPQEIAAEIIERVRPLVDGTDAPLATLIAEFDEANAPGPEPEELW